MHHNAIAAERAICMYTIEGTTEKQIADRMRTSLYELGGDYSPFMSLAAGKHSGEHHAVPGDYQVQRDDIVAVDMVGLLVVTTVIMRVWLLPATQGVAVRSTSNAR